MSSDTGTSQTLLPAYQGQGGRNRKRHANGPIPSKNLPPFRSNGTTHPSSGLGSDSDIRPEPKHDPKPDDNEDGTEPIPNAGSAWRVTRCAGCWVLRNRSGSDVGSTADVSLTKAKHLRCRKSLAISEQVRSRNRPATGKGRSPSRKGPCDTRPEAQDAPQIRGPLGKERRSRPGIGQKCPASPHQRPQISSHLTTHKRQGQGQKNGLHGSGNYAHQHQLTGSENERKTFSPEMSPGGRQNQKHLSHFIRRKLFMPSRDHKVDKIIVVDDDARIRELLRRFLQQEGFEVLLAEDGKALSRLLLRESVDLIVLDLMMPGEDGLTICKRMRGAHDRTPIIMLTAKSEDVDRIVGLEVGADDYMCKPFNPRELLARIQAVLRRRPPMEAPGAPSNEPESVEFGPFTFELSQRKLRKNGVEVSLTTGEFAMLKALVRHAKQPLSREKLAQLARGRELEAFDRSLDVQVSRLRKLIEEDASSPRYIQTVWGVGYVFVPNGDN